MPRAAALKARRVGSMSSDFDLKGAHARQRGGRVGFVARLVTGPGCRQRRTGSSQNTMVNCFGCGMAPAQVLLTLE